MSRITGRDDEFLKPYPEEYREWAFQLWFLLYDQNSAKVADRINNPQPDDPIVDVRDPREIKSRTIRKWAQTYKWAEQAQQRFKELAPGIHERVITTMAAGSIEAADLLRHVVNDEDADTKYRVDAAKTILDRAGHLPFNRPSDDSRPQGPSRDYSGSIAGKSTEDIIRFLLDPAPAIGDGTPPSTVPEE